MRRRAFIKTFCVGACAAAAGAMAPLGRPAGRAFGGDKAPRPRSPAEKEFYREARFYEKLADERIRCLICPRRCVVDDVERGYCGVRENVGGTYHTVVYGRVCTYHVDPVEKKPLFHFLPGTTAFSLATVGCNMECKFCQNWEISQERPENVDAADIPPNRVVEAARMAGAPTVAYTYTEPTVYYEFMLDTATAGRTRGLKNVMISSGFINHDPLVALTDAMDAIKIDLKAFTPEFYTKTCNASLKPVLDSIVTVRESRAWLEIVYLVIPTLNDGERDIDLAAKWLLDNVGSEVPLHFTRFSPTFRLANLPPTTVASVERARDIARGRGLKYVYVGNVPAGHPGESTYCPKCGEVVIGRAGYMIVSRSLNDGKCAKCGAVIRGVWS